MLTMLMYNDEEIWINSLSAFTDHPSPESCYVIWFFFFFKLGDNPSAEEWTRQEENWIALREEDL